MIISLILDLTVSPSQASPSVPCVGIDPFHISIREQNEKSHLCQPAQHKILICTLAHITKVFGNFPDANNWRSLCLSLRKHERAGNTGELNSIIKKISNDSFVQLLTLLQSD